MDVMPENGYLVEEIIVIASCVLCLVVLLGFLIMYNTNSERPTRERDTDKQRGSTATRGTRDRADSAQVVGSYRDDTFFDNVRRRSVALAEDLKRELWSVKRNVSLSGAMLDPRPADPGVTVSLQNFTTRATGNAIARSQRDNVGDESEGHVAADSMLSTRRDETVKAERGRSSRMPSDRGGCDLEAQDSDDWSP